MMDRDQLLDASLEPNVHAFLDVLAACEGTAGPDGYRTVFGGGRFESFERHPQRLVTATLAGKPIASTAAGRYQFLSRTWSTLVDQYGFPSFEPRWQDAGAVALIAGRGALEDLRAGRLEAAVAKCAPEWASLPGAPYGQPTKHISFVRDVYLRSGGRLDGGAPIEARTRPSAAPPTIGVRPEPAPPAPASPEARPMSPFLIPALEALIGLAPTLGKLFKGEAPSRVAERNMAAFEAVADKVVPIVVAATGSPNLQAAVEAAQGNPAVAQRVDQAVRENFAELHELAERSIAQRQDFAVRWAAQRDVRTVMFGWTFIELLSAWLVVSGTFAGWYVLWAGEGQFGNQMIGSVITLLVIGGVVAVRDFWIGTSMESRRKTDMLQEREPPR